jgi:phosphoribosylglycinamide formyltransferase-1
VKRLAILASGSGSNAQALLDASLRGDLAAEVVVVVSDRAGAGVLQRATRAGVAALALPCADRRDSQTRAAYDGQLADVVAAFRPDLIVLAGWMLILGAAFLDRFAGRIINVHPALLPDGEEATVLTSQGELPALRGARAVRDALRQGLPLTGATVHYVTTTVDTGPVIVRAEVPIEPGDNEERLHARIKAVEHRLLPRAVAMALSANREEKGQWE